MKIVGHCLIKNEENFIWYAINSVIDYLDEIMVWDNGSTDNTVSIIKSINSKKIKFRQVGGDVAEIRQQMLDETEADWIFILDGDEVWWEKGIRSLVSSIRSSDFSLAVSPNYMLIGDMYHYQEEKAGRYRIAGKVGHYNIRAIRKTKGLHVEGVYPNEAYENADGVKIQNFSKEKILFLKEKYLHASFLSRSSKDTKKVKYELGEEFPKDFYCPEVFFRPRPAIVPSIWRNMDFKFKLRAFFETPLRKINRRYFI